MSNWRIVGDLGYLSSLLTLDREDDRPLDFHGAFVPAVAENLILRHTKPGDWIWDPFAGSGTTGIVARQLDRNCFLSDLSPTDESIHYHPATAPVWLNEETLLPQTSPQYSDEQFVFDMVILHPPYHNIIKFSDKQEDLSNLADPYAFAHAFAKVCANINQHLKPGGYLGLVIGDVWEKGVGVIPLGFWCMEAAMLAIQDARLKAIVVKDIKGNRHNTGRENLLKSRLFRWGAVQFQHEYIFSIQKGK